MPAASAGCEKKVTAETNCPAHTGNPALWASSEGRFTDSGAIKRKPKRAFWLGAEIGNAELKVAKASFANELILGWVFGSYEVWVNGERIAGISSDEELPTVISLPLSYLEKDSLKIALLIEPDSEMGAADTLARPWSEGLATPAQAAAFRSAAVFWKISRPLALFLLNSLFAILFFLLWTVYKKKQEYLYFAIYGAICAFVQVRLMSAFSGTFNASETRAFDLFLYSAEGIFGLLMAMAFARSNKKVFLWGSAIALIAPWIAFFPLDAFQAVSSVNVFLRKWFVPGAHLVGALVCLLQAWAISQNGYLQAKTRIKSLLGFAFGMLLISILFAVNSNDLISLTGQALASRFGHFVILFLLAGLAMREYGEEKKLLQRAHVSKYHRLKILPEKISGALLAVDLKGSERLFKISADSPEHGGLVEMCLSHLWSAVIANKGTVLQTEGDGLKAFFDDQDCGDSVAAALAATEQMKGRLEAFLQELKEKEIVPGENFSLDFRGGISKGELRPSWQKIDLVQVPSWSETGKVNPFLESARLMEVERQLPEGGDCSLVVVSVEAARETLSLKFLPGHWLVDGRRLLGKHDRIFLVSAYRPGGQVSASQGFVKAA